ncbi:MAG TPA: signal peptidase II [Burkholderiaceae bacterium]
MARSPSRSGARGGPSLWLWLAISLVVVLLDQFAKALIVADFRLYESRPVTSFFSVVRWQNTGAAWSFLHDAGGWQRWFFVGLAVAASLFMLWLLLRNGSQTLFCFAIAMVLGGAVGNLVDRIGRGSVVDFLLLHYRDVYTFPAFNLADSAITLGAACLLFDELRRVLRSR